MRWGKPLSEERPEFEPRFLQGIEHFNQREFWEAHESWEELWLAASTEMEQFLQGLIQVAAAYHHIKKGTFPGSVRLFDAALRRLEPFAADYCGLERKPLIARCLEHRAWVAELLQRAKIDKNVLSGRLAPGQYPKIDLTEDWRSALPKSDF